MVLGMQMDKVKRVLLVQQTPFAQGFRGAGIQGIVEIAIIKDSQFGHGLLALFLGWLGGGWVGRDGRCAGLDRCHAAAGQGSPADPGQGEQKLARQRHQDSGVLVGPTKNDSRGGLPPCWRSASGFSQQLHDLLISVLVVLAKV